MSRFNSAPPAPRPTVRNAHYGEGFARDAREELFVLASTNFVGHDSFYERGGDRDARMVALVHDLARTDPDWVAAFAAWLRDEGNMRSASLIVAAEYLRAGGRWPRRVIASVLLRADEPGEMLGYWITNYGRNLPMPLKRGISDACARLYTQRNALRFDGTNKEYRWADVIRLCHAKPVDAEQATLYRHLIGRRLSGSIGFPEPPVPFDLRLLDADRRLMSAPNEARRALLSTALDSRWPWERVAGWLPGGMDAEAWSALIPTMGVGALLRNLRNFDEARVPDHVAQIAASKIGNPVDVHASRVLPMQFLTAWKVLTSMRWGPALEAGLNASVENLPDLPGRTLILVDISPSMDSDLAVARTDGGKRGVTVTPPLRWEAAGVFGIALAQRCEEADVYLFDFDPTHKLDVLPHDSILRLTTEIGRLVKDADGTDTLGALARTYKGHDRVVILTDEQTGAHAGRSWNGRRGLHVFGTWDDVSQIKCPVLTWNLDGSAVGHTPSGWRNWHTYGGLNDAAFRTIRTVERRSRGGWPWENPVPVADRISRLQADVAAATVAP